MLQKTQIIIVTTVAIIFFVFGYAFSFLFKIESLGISNNSYQAGWDAAKNRLLGGGFYVPLAEVKVLSGEIKDINDDKITFKIHPLEPLADPSLDERIAVVNSITKIYKMEPKTQKDYMTGIDAYNKARKAGKLVDFPLMYDKIEIPASDLKTGQKINVSADENIIEAKQFIALEIIVNSSTLPAFSAPAPTQ